MTRHYADQANASGASPTRAQALRARNTRRSRSARSSAPLRTAGPVVAATATTRSGQSADTPWTGNNSRLYRTASTPPSDGNIFR